MDAHTNMPMAWMGPRIRWTLQIVISQPCHCYIEQTHASNKHTHTHTYTCIGPQASSVACIRTKCIRKIHRHIDTHVRIAHTHTQSHEHTNKAALHINFSSIKKKNNLDLDGKPIVPTSLPYDRCACIEFVDTYLQHANCIYDRWIWTIDAHWFFSPLTKILCHWSFIAWQ